MFVSATKPAGTFPLPFLSSASFGMGMKRTWWRFPTIIKVTFGLAVSIASEAHTWSIAPIKKSQREL